MSGCIDPLEMPDGPPPCSICGGDACELAPIDGKDREQPVCDQCHPDDWFACADCGEIRHVTQAYRIAGPRLYCPTCYAGDARVIAEAEAASRADVFRDAFNEARR